MKKTKFLIILVFLTISLYPISSVQADMAPPRQPPGANLAPGEEITQVRMLAETVVIDVQPYGGRNDLGWAKVTADFTMRNLGNEVESMAARFPVGVENPFWDAEITQFMVSINGYPTQSRRIDGEDPSGMSDHIVPWEEFNITFPPDKDVKVRITYNFEAMGYFPHSYFSYILSTGAGWNGTIGSADIIARFPYEISSLNTGIDSNAVRDGNEIRWHYENLEPTYKDNIEFFAVSPAFWQNILIERGNIRINQNDGEAWGRLGMYYKDIALDNKRILRNEEAYYASVDAYEKCLELLPDDALWHAGFADLLWWNSQRGNGGSDGVLRALQEIHYALELDPENEQIQEIADSMTWGDEKVSRNDDGTYTFFWLTATPIPTVTMAPAAFETTPEPTTTLAVNIEVATPTLAVVDTVTPTFSSETPSPICGAAALPTGLVAFIFIFRKKNEDK